MNRTFFLRKEDCKADWHVIDASDQVLGRMATQIANLLRGKGKAAFAPQTNCGDYVIVINCDKIKLTGDKWNQKVYKRFSGWRSGLKSRTAEEMLEKKPTDIVRLAVKRMLPKNRLSSEVINRLKVYTGDQHPHIAQVTTTQQQKTA
ncbi:50S ribosomal protein L13 [Candidatus Dependentiae bacterium]|nr:50S ribosomal protein L13 [Candidatus Dependentiae bacterium]